MRVTFAKAAIASLGVTLAASAASAQSVVTRSITAEPVETTVTQTPSGTIVTKRPVTGGGAATSIVETEPATIDEITTREVVRRRDANATRRVQSRRAEPRRTETRQLVTREVAARPDTLRRTTTTTRTVRPAPRLVLTPDERRIVTRTIVQREVYPRTVVVPQQPVVVPPPGLIAQAPVVAADDEYDDEPTYTVGSVLPDNVPLYAMPQNVALSVPATRPYSYAHIGGRTYLVNPTDGMVVADVTD